MSYVRHEQELCSGLAAISGGIQVANVFISHRGTDAVESENLARELRAAGHNVWLDAWEITLGDSIIRRINEGLSSSSFLILCLSSSGVMAPWMSREWMAALASQLEGRSVRILPVRLTGGELPDIIRDFQYADLTKDWKKGVSQVLLAIDKHL